MTIAWISLCKFWPPITILPSKVDRPPLPPPLWIQQLIVTYQLVLNREVVNPYFGCPAEKHLEFHDWPPDQNWIFNQKEVATFVPWMYGRLYVYRRSFPSSCYFARIKCNFWLPENRQPQRAIRDIWGKWYLSQFSWSTCSTQAF